MTEVTLSQRTAVALSKALEKATKEINSGRMGLTPEGQDSLDARVRNLPKLELLGVIGAWMREHRLAGGIFGKRAVLLEMMSGRASYRKALYLFFSGASWHITESEYTNIYSLDQLVRYSKYYALPESQRAQDLLDTVAFDVIAKGWVVFAQERGIPLPTEVTQAEEGKFSLYINRQPSDPLLDMR